MQLFLQETPEPVWLLRVSCAKSLSGTRNKDEGLGRGELTSGETLGFHTQVHTWAYTAGPSMRCEQPPGAAEPISSRHGGHTRSPGPRPRDLHGPPPGGSPAERPHGRDGPPRGSVTTRGLGPGPLLCLSDTWALLGWFVFFEGTGEEEGQGYWCIKWLRPLHFLPGATERLFIKVSLCFS